MKRLPALCAAALSLASCVTVPKSLAEGEVDILVLAYEQVRERDPLTGYPTPRTRLEPVGEVVCEMRNDKGSWTATTSARVGDRTKVRVHRSEQPLEVECWKEGYERVANRLECTSRHEQQAKSHQGPMAAVMTAMLPLALLTPAGVMWAAEGIYLAAAGTQPDLCTYWGVFPPMVRRDDPQPMAYGWRRASR